MSGAAASLKALTGAVLDACRKHGIMLATAESCTGGMIAAALCCAVSGAPGSASVDLTWTASTDRLAGDFGVRRTARGSQSVTPFPVGAGDAYSSRSSAHIVLVRFSHPTGILSTSVLPLWDNHHCLAPVPRFASWER